MVDVIIRGQIPEDRVHEASCSHCNSLLRFKQSEAILTGDQREGDYLVVTCPVCNRSVTKALTRQSCGQFGDH